MIRRIKFPFAILRGRYVMAVARMEANGTPIDVKTWERLRAAWDRIREGLIEAVGSEYRVRDERGNWWPIYDGTTFKYDRFDRYLVEQGISWPGLTSEALDLSDDAFRQMVKIHPQLAGLRETRHALSQLRLAELSVGRDGRNRCMLSPYSARTSRNQPSNVKFIFGPSVWLRGLIRPEPGSAIAYLDWSGQECGIAAALSGDERMMADYRGGDPYLAFASRVGAVPAHATKLTHPAERERFKIALGLGAMYGAGADRVAGVIGGQPAYAADLLQQHRRLYSKFWAWQDGVVSHAMMHSELHTAFGWRLHVGPDANPRSLSNFPMQGNGAEMLRLACCSATEAGIGVCCPVHDAILVEGPVDEIGRIVEETKSHMARASRDVLEGFELRTGVEVIAYPHRYRDEKRGGAMWDRVMGLLERIEKG
jgi:DNA polymerase I